MDEDQLESLPPVDWGDVTKQLVAYASYKISVKPKWNRGGKKLPGGEEAKDIVQGAFKLFLEGKRKWNQKAYPDILMFLKSVVSSILDARIKSRENVTATAFNTSVPETEIEIYSSDSCTPEELLVNREDLEARSKKDEAIKKFIDDQNDEDLTAVFLAMIYESSKPQTISEATDIELQKVYNLVKRVRRILKTFENHQ